MAWGNQGMSHYEYGAGSWSVYYWDPSYNPGATKELCMANCTTYAYGRVRENGLPRPVSQFRNANNWHLYVANGWQKIDYYSGMALQQGDIVEWEANHVAVVETNGTNPYVSSSWYTECTLRYDAVSSMQIISGWMVINAPGRFYRYVTLTTENSGAGGGAYPKYVLRYNGSGPTPGGDTPDVTFTPSSYTATLSSNDDYIDFNYTVTVTGIPVGDDAGSAISFSNNCYRYMYTSNWTYTTYTSGGTTYQRGVRSLIVRYDRLHDYAYTDNAYMYYNKSFSNGSASGSTRMRITIEEIATLGDDLITFIKTLAKRRKKRFTSKIY